MNRKHKAWIGGGMAFGGTYVGISILGKLVTPALLAGVLTWLVALFMGAWVADQIDPVHQ